MSRRRPMTLSQAASVYNFPFAAGARINFVNYRGDAAPPVKQSNAANLGTARSQPAVAAVGNFAIFAGGSIQDGFETAAMDAYNLNTLARSSGSLSLGRHTMGASSVGDFALFGGGRAWETLRLATVDAYSSALVHSVPTALSTARGEVGGSRNQNFALFGGGRTTNFHDSALATVDAYNSSLVRSTPAQQLTAPRSDLAGANVGEFALFGGGVQSDGFAATNVQAYNGSLTHSTPVALGSAISGAGSGLGFGNFALFGSTTNIEVYSHLLVRQTPVAISIFAGNLANLGGVFALHNNGLAVGAINQTLTVIVPPAPFNAARGNNRAIGGESHVLIGGGHIGGTVSGIVEVYSSLVPLLIYPNAQYNLGGGIITASVLTTLQLTRPVNGWINIRSTTVQN